MDAYRIIGIESSPYAVKVRAVMRYRHLPHRWIARMPQFFTETADVRPLIMPVVQFPDGTYHTDSTPIIYRLEDLHPSQRSVLPDMPALAFVAALIEDFADEWVTKALFNYRFSSAGDQQAGAAWVMDDAHPDLAHEELAHFVESFIERQVKRMPLVGCTPKNTPVLTESYFALLGVLEQFVATDRFLFGSRPSIADFGLYAQLKTMATDPTAGELMRERAPRLRRWIGRTDDMSGVDGEWRADVSSLPPATLAVLELCGRYYLPLLEANAAAMDAGEGEFSVTLNGREFRQSVFRYHKKCFAFLRSRYDNLSASERASVQPLLEQTQCAAYFAT